MDKQFTFTKIEFVPDKQYNRDCLQELFPVACRAAKGELERAAKAGRFTQEHRQMLTLLGSMYKLLGGAE